MTTTITFQFVGLALAILISPSQAWTNGLGACGTTLSPLSAPFATIRFSNSAVAGTSNNRGAKHVPRSTTTSTLSTTTTTLHMTSDDEEEPAVEAPPSQQRQQPSTFREAEILGLRMMQEGNYEQAVQVFEAALKLPGSRPDIIRTKVYATSPVGGGMGGTESQSVLTLDEFELQAVYYNMACANAQLQNLPQAMANLQLALENGFDNFATVRADTDLKPLQDLPEFETLLKKYEPKPFFFGGSSSKQPKKTSNASKAGSSSSGFNPFGFFGNK